MAGLIAASGTRSESAALPLRPAFHIHPPSPPCLAGHKVGRKLRPFIGWRPAGASIKSPAGGPWRG